MFDRAQFKLKKWLWQFDHEPKVRVGFGILLILVLFIGTGSYLALHFASQVINKELTQKLSLISEKFGVEIKAGKTSIGLFSIELDAIQIIDGSNILRLKEIQFGWRLSSAGLQIDEIKVRATEAEIDADLALSRGLAIFSAFKEQSPESEGVYARAGRFLSSDARITLRNGKWKIRSLSQEILVSGLSVDASLAEEHNVYFQASSVTVGAHKIFSKTSGSFSLDEKHNLQISLTNALGDKLWIDSNRFLTDIQIKGTLVSSSRFLTLFNGVLPGQFNAQNLVFEFTLQKTSPQDYQGRLQANVGSLTVANEKITNLPFDLYDVAFTSRFKLDGAKNRIRFFESKIELPTIEADQTDALILPIDMTIQLAENLLPQFLDVEVQDLKLSCQKLIDILPKDAIPVIKGFRFSGDIAFDMSFNFDIKKRTAVEHAFNYKEFNCQSEKFPDAYSKKSLESTLTVTRHPRFTESFEIVVGTESPQFSPIGSISPQFVKALVSSEDAAFFSHPGYDLSALEDAFDRNILNGEFAVGGSTITMQTIKNLYLGSQKNILRKVQEIYLSAHIESQISKYRILEIYSNLAEFGPNIFGVSEAAQVYFGKKPMQLTLKESIFLVSLLPSPVVRFRQYCGSRISFGYQNLMDNIAERMHRLGRIDYSTYQHLNSTPLVFNSDSIEREKRCFLNRPTAKGAESVPKDEKNLEL